MWQSSTKSFRTYFGIYLFFYLLNFYFHFLVPTRKRNKRNSRRRFRSHENSIIQQLSLTTRDFVYFLMFQNHSNSSTLCFINILGSLRYCRFFSYVIFVIFYFSSFQIHSKFISESNMEEMLKQVQHDSWVSRHSEFISESNTEEMLK